MHSKVCPFLSNSFEFRDDQWQQHRDTRLIRQNCIKSECMAWCEKSESCKLIKEKSLIVYNIKKTANKIYSKLKCKHSQE